MLKINLMENTYTVDVITAKHLKKVIAFKKKNDILQAQTKAGEDKTEEMIDSMIDFIVSVYNDRFTAEEVWDKLELADLQPTFDETINTIMAVFEGTGKKK